MSPAGPGRKKVAFYCATELLALAWEYKVPHRTNSAILRSLLFAAAIERFEVVVTIAIVGYIMVISFVHHGDKTDCSSDLS